MENFLIFIVMVITPWLTANPVDTIHGEYTVTGYRLGENCAYADVTPYPVDANRRVYWSTAGGNCANGVAPVLVNVQDDALMTYCGFRFTAYDWMGRAIKSEIIYVTNPYWSGPSYCWEAPR